MTGSQKYLRAPEIAAELGMTERTVRRWIADGTLLSVKIRGARLVARTELERVLDCSQNSSEDED